MDDIAVELVAIGRERDDRAVSADVRFDRVSFNNDEADERYFGVHRKEKRGRGAGGKVPVFGLLKRCGKVFTVIIPDAKATTLLPITREQAKPDSIVYTGT